MVETGPTIPLIYPEGGLDENQRKGEQPPITSFDELNMRVEDPLTGRGRGAQRAGLSPFMVDPGTGNTLILGVNKVKELVQLKRPERQVTYSVPNAPIEEGTFKLPKGLDCKGLVRDSVGNLYAFDGPSAIVKLNPDLQKVFSVELPVESELDVARALFVDELNRIYVGISSSDDDLNGRVLQYAQNADGSVDLSWTLELSDGLTGRAGGLVTDIVVQAGVMYLVQNSDVSHRAFLARYSGLYLDSPPPRDWIRLVPYPANHVVLNSAGEIFTSSPPFSDTFVDPDLGNTAVRTINPQYPNFSTVTEAWLPQDLDDWEKTGWAFYDAAQITAGDTISQSLEDGVEVTRWRDITGNGRDLFINPSDANARGPQYVQEGFGGRPGLRFGLVPGSTDLKRYLISGSSPGVLFSIVDRFLTLLPGFKAEGGDADKASMYAMFIVFRAKSGDDDSVISPLIYQPNDLSAFEELVAINREDNSSLGSGTGFSAGQMSHFTDTDAGDPGDGSGGQPESFSYENSMSGGILTIINDGGVESGDTTKTRSLLRFNGVAIDRYESDPFESDKSASVGWDSGDISSGSAAAAEVEVASILVLRRKDADDQTEPKILSHPFDPDITSLASGGQVGYLNITAGGTGYPNSGNVTASGGGGIGFTATYTASSGVIQTVTITSGGTGFTTVPTFTADGGGTGATFSGSLHDIVSDTELERIEGALMHKVGMSHLLPFGVPLHPYHLSRGAPPPATGPDTNDFNSTNGLICKFSPTKGDLKYVKKSAAGVGSGLAINSEGDIYSVGPNSPGVFRFIDQGDDATVGFEDGGLTLDPDDNLLGVAVDENDNLYVPMVEKSSGSFQFSLRVYSKGGDILVNYSFPNIAVGLGSFAVVVPPAFPDYGTDLVADDPDEDKVSRAEFAYIATSSSNHTGSVSDLDTLRKIRLVSADAKADIALREHFYLGVTGGDLKRFQRLPTPSVFTPTDSTAVFDPGAANVFSQVAYQKAFFTDGLGYKLYDPEKDAVEDWVAKSAGQIPQRCQFIALYRGRLVLANRTQYFFSKAGDPFNWEFDLPEDIPGQAFSGVLADLGGPPDLLNCIAPANEDFLYLGGEESITRMVGDPSRGGEIDLVTDQIGMAYGRPYCVGDDGVLYFISSRGEAYYLTTGSGSFPLPLPARGGDPSQSAVVERLRSINFKTHYVRLYWSYRPKGFHVLVHPFGEAPFTDVEHFFWEKRYGAWHPDRFPLKKQPTAAVFFDADAADDRRFIIGSEGGVVYFLDENAVSDDGEKIESYVTMGPIAPPNSPTETRFDRLKAVLSRDGGGYFEFYTNEEPDFPFTASVNGDLGPGRNDSKSLRVRGSNIWARFGNSHPAERWAFESATVEFQPVGAKVKR